MAFLTYLKIWSTQRNTESRDWRNRGSDVIMVWLIHLDQVLPSTAGFPILRAGKCVHGLKSKYPKQHISTDLQPLGMNLTQAILLSTSKPQVRTDSLSWLSQVFFSLLCYSDSELAGANSVSSWALASPQTKKGTSWRSSWVLCSPVLTFWSLVPCDRLW